MSVQICGSRGNSLHICIRSVSGTYTRGTLCVKVQTCNAGIVNEKTKRLRIAPGLCGCWAMWNKFGRAASYGKYCMYLMWSNTKAEYPTTTHRKGVRTQKRNGIGRDKRPSSNKSEEKHIAGKFTRVRRWKGKQKDGE